MNESEELKNMKQQLITMELENKKLLQENTKLLQNKKDNETLMIHYSNLIKQTFNPTNPTSIRLCRSDKCTCLNHLSPITNTSPPESPMINTQSSESPII